jgi:hypothetical protein
MDAALLGVYALLGINLVVVATGYGSLRQQVKELIKRQGKPCDEHTGTCERVSKVEQQLKDHVAWDGRTERRKS